MRAPTPSLLFACALLMLSAETAPAYEIRKEGVMLEPRLSVGEDFQLGVRSGYGLCTWEGFQGAVFLDGEFRPVPWDIRTRSTPTFSYQHQETRWSVGPGVSAGYDFTDSFTGSVGIGLAYTDAFYWGSNRTPGHGWIGWAETGFRQALSDWSYWGMTLQVRPLPDLFPARVLLQFVFNFGEEISP